MLFIKIDENIYPCEVSPFTTQIGTNAIRVISEEAPIAENGFLILDENNEVIIDCTKFIRLYRENGDCKEYIEREESVIPVEGFYMGDVPLSPYTVLSREIASISSYTNGQINDLSNQVESIEPYKESKTAYIEDTEVIFDIVKNGNISIFMIDEDGYNVPFTFERINNQIIVSFEKRESLATVTMSIQ